MLDELDSTNIVVVDDQIPKHASSDTPVHLAIYRDHPDTRALYHTHGDYSVALSMLTNRIVFDFFLGDRFFEYVNVVEGEFGAPLLTDEIAKGLHNNAVLVRGHGSFVTGRDLRQGYVLSCALERACKVLYLRMLLSAQQTGSEEGK